MQHIKVQYLYDNSITCWTSHIIILMCTLLCINLRWEKLILFFLRGLFCCHYLLKFHNVWVIEWPFNLITEQKFWYLDPVSKKTVKASEYRTFHPVFRPFDQDQSGSWTMAWLTDHWMIRWFWAINILCYPGIRIVTEIFILADLE